MQYDHHRMGEVIRRVLKQKRKSQDVLSGLAGMDRTHLAKIETGQHSANAETLWKIADALDMPLSELFRLVEDETDK
ncbi:MAG: helix-turn-helix transcriptional regulator [Clostridia bacterium]|nr:helix-turn-helix transcriptional regulator [Clostridia bacterium]